MLALKQSDSSITLDDIAGRWQRDAGFALKMDAALRRILSLAGIATRFDPDRMLTLFDQLKDGTAPVCKATACPCR